MKNLIDALLKIVFAALLVASAERNLLPKKTVGA